MGNVVQENEKAISGAIKIDEKEIRTHLDGLVRQSVEDTLNALLNAEADAICQASRYQRSPDRQDTRAGSYKRKLLTKAGEVELRIPRLRTLPFETQIIERYKTKQSSVEMYLTDASVQQKVPVFRLERAEAETLLFFLDKGPVRFFRSNPGGAETRRFLRPLREIRTSSGEGQAIFSIDSLLFSEQTFLKKKCLLD